MPAEDYEMLVSKKPDAVIVIVMEYVSTGDMYDWQEHDASVQMRIAREVGFMHCFGFVLAACTSYCFSIATLSCAIF
jgi:hypothetical protein